MYILGPLKKILLGDSTYYFGYRGLFLGSEEWSPRGPGGGEVSFLWGSQC